LLTIARAGTTTTYDVVRSTTRDDVSSPPDTVADAQFIEGQVQLAGRLVTLV
jgi:hypothetical protein